MDLNALVSNVRDQLSAVVRTQITENIILVAGVEKEIQNISTNLRKIQQVLDDAETRQTKNSNIKEFLEKLEDFSYEMEDVVDEWSTEIHRNQVEADELVEKVWCCFLSYVLCFKLCKGRHDIAVKIKKLNAKLELIVKDKDKYNFLPSVKVKSKEWKRTESTSFVDVIFTPGQNKAKDELIRKLCTITKDLVPIIKVIGSGGIGKTTLAQLAFNDGKVEAQFDKKIWVWVGESFDGLKIANQIRKGLDSRSKDESAFISALDNIKDSIDKQKVLLVLDDVWMVNENDWEKLKRYLSDVASGNKIVVTSRFDDVAKSLGATDEVSVPLLADNDCWQVIKNIALWGKSGDMGKLEDVGMKIAKKCKGLPLAAKALGGLLRFRETKKEWEEVQNSELWRLEGIVDDVFPHFQLSYNDLPSPMKRCFVFSAILPKSWAIDANDLIRMWIAQGYVTTKRRGEDMEQVGKEYLNGLASRAFFQEVGKIIDGTLFYTMHDIVHDFAQYLAKEECVTIGDATEADSCKDARHLAIRLYHAGALSVPVLSVHDVGALAAPLLSVYQTGKTRTFIISAVGVSERTLRLFCYLKRLRILRIHAEEVDRLPEEIGNLIHLRLLDVEYTKIEKLPDKICNLYNLQALICGTYMKKLPPKIDRLMNLRSLRFDTDLCGVLVIPQSIARLTSLQDLPFYHVGKEFNKLSYLRNLNQLRGGMTVHFGDSMSGQEDVEDAKKAEFEKKKFDSLVLEWRNIDIAMDVIEALQPHTNLSKLKFSGYRGDKLPNWITYLSGLTHLILNSCPHLKSFPPLWKLPVLEELEVIDINLRTLWPNEFLGVEETADQNYTSFPSLKTLSFVSLRYLWAWVDICEVAALQQESRLSTIVMPCLEHLLVSDTRKLKELPYNLLSKATKLQSIHFNNSKYGPITSLSSNKPPFVPLGGRRTTISEQYGIPEMGPIVQTLPSAPVVPEVGECAEERQAGDEQIPVVEEMKVHEDVPIGANRPLNTVFMANVPAETNGQTFVDKSVVAEEDDPLSVVPKPPFYPSNDFYYDNSKYSLLSSWIDKNKHRLNEIGLVPTVQLYDAISAHKLDQICSDGWLYNEDTDAILQLFNLQGKRHPDMYKSTKWTCLGSLYNVAVRSEYTMFIENRQKEEGGTATSEDLYKFVKGNNKNWESKAWCECDFVFGIENINNSHFAAYSYDFKNKTVNVYDSMKNVLEEERTEVFKKHATIAPSFYNLKSDKSDDDMLNPDIPFTINIVTSVPQQPNSWDCGVYACKFIQCLVAMQDFSELDAARFPCYRKKLAIDLIKWTTTSMFAFHELPIKIGKSSPLT